MKNILISSIFRNRENYIEGWYEGIKSLSKIDKDNKYYLSVYENDSEDKTFDKLKNLDFSFLEGVSLKTEKLNTPIFDSFSKAKDRVILIAEARNKSIYSNPFLNQCSHLLVIEPDIRYDPSLIIKEIINKGDYDIISPRSVDIDRNCYFYDDWGTRQTDKDGNWKCFSVNILRMLGVIPVWTTFNCLCLYKAEPFKNFITFEGFNSRINAYDCDTAVVCENFRKNNYSNIVLNSSVEIYHSRKEFNAFNIVIPETSKNRPLIRNFCPIGS